MKMRKTNIALFVPDCFSSILKQCKELKIIVKKIKINEISSQ